MSKQKDFIAEDFLDELFNTCLNNKDVFLLVKEHLRDNYVEDDQYLLIWREINKQFKMNEALPTTRQLKQIFRRNDVVIDYLEKIRLADIGDSSVQSLLNIFENYIKQKKFIELHEKSADEYNLGNKERAYEILDKASRELSEFSLDLGELTQVFKGFPERHIDRSFGVYGGRTVIPTGIDPIDEFTEGGPITGETLIYLGDSGVGKSTLLVYHGVIAAKNGYDVLHFQVEGTKQQCLNMYDSCWTGATYKEMRDGGLPDGRYEAYKKVLTKMQGEVHVYAAEQFGSVSVNDLRNQCKDMKKRCGNNFKVLIVDYLTLLETSNGISYGPAYERFKMNRLGRDFKNICVEFDLLGITVAQSNTVSPELLNDPDFYMTRYNIGEGKRLIEPFSYHITINQTKDEYDENLARLYFDKLREHRSGQLVTIAQNLKRKRFYDRKRSLEIAS